MDIKILVSTFWMIFLAELGDKTQLATLCFAANTDSRFSVFLGSSVALILTSLLAVIIGGELHRLVPANYIKVGAGVVFVLLGFWMIFLPGGK